MIRRLINRIRLNFKSSASDRSATASYRNSNRQVKRVFKNTGNVFKKLNKASGGYKFK